MLLASWNVNGLRACMKKGFIESRERLNADVLCLQEIRLNDYDEIEKSLINACPAACEWHPCTVKKGYSGTAAFTKIQPISVSRGFPSPISDVLPDGEGRVLTLTYPSFHLITVYSPNAQFELRRIDYRMLWEDGLRAYVSQLDKDKPVVVCGDLNVAHNEIDLAHPSANRGSNGFSDEERGKMTQLLGAGFIDTYRRMHPEQKAAYTWWSNIASSRSRNVGWRIDYFLVSERLWDKVIDTHIYPDIMGSDHCPVGLTIDLPDK